MKFMKKHGAFRNINLDFCKLGEEFRKIT
jgi:hypothetical protein